MFSSPSSSCVILVCIRCHKRSSKETRTQEERSISPGHNMRSCTGFDKSLTGYTLKRERVWDADVLLQVFFSFCLQLVISWQVSFLSSFWWILIMTIASISLVLSSLFVKDQTLSHLLFQKSQPKKRDELLLDLQSNLEMKCYNFFSENLVSMSWIFSHEGDQVEGNLEGWVIAKRWHGIKGPPLVTDLW